jgi:hypothetical protein
VLGHHGHLQYTVCVHVVTQRVGAQDEESSKGRSGSDAQGRCAAIHGLTSGCTSAPQQHTPK